MALKAYWKESTKEVFVKDEDDATPVPAGFTSLIGEFPHDQTEDNLPGMQGYHGSHVLYHHIQDALYRRGHTDMQAWKIISDVEVTAPVVWAADSFAFGGNNVNGGTITWGAVNAGPTGVEITYHVFISAASNTAENQWVHLYTGTQRQATLPADSTGKFVRMYAIAVHPDDENISARKDAGPHGPIGAA